MEKKKMTQTESYFPPTIITITNQKDGSHFHSGSQLLYLIVLWHADLKSIFAYKQLHEEPPSTIPKQAQST